LKNKYVLIVDDSASVRMLAKRILEKEGIVILEAEGVEAGLDLASKHSIDLILLDVEMPDKDGFDFLREKAQVPSLVSIKVLMLSGRNDAASIEQATSLGALDFILKPFKPSSLLEVVKKYI
jgi:CheY-like chemotaxis protein